jgi:hypothetical protein
MSWKPTRATLDWLEVGERHQSNSGLTGTGDQQQYSLVVADKLVKTSATTNDNYWSLLACLVEEQDEPNDNQMKVEQIAILVPATKPKNNIKEK